MDLHCARNTGAQMRLGVVIQLGQAEIREFRIELRVEENVTRLHVSVYNPKPGFLVKIS